MSLLDGGTEKLCSQLLENINVHIFSIGENNGAHFQGIADIAKSFKRIFDIEIEPYHSFGNDKYVKLSKTDAIHCYSIFS